LPSAGPKINPQIYLDSAKSQKEHNADENRKRKRNNDDDNRLDASLDFFAASREGADQSLLQDRTEEPSDAEVVDIEQTELPSMSLEERKEILKRQKLKITLISEPDKKEKKKRKREKLSKNDIKHADSIYPEPVIDLRELKTRYNISSRLDRNIREQGFKVPTEVQMASLSLLLGGIPDQDEERKIDLLTIAPTGSGKTLAFLIPLLDSLIKESVTSTYTGPQAVILAPTKELVNQIVNEARKLAMQTGLNIKAARKEIILNIDKPEQDRVDILVGTPLSVAHLLQGNVDADQAEITTPSTISDRPLKELSSVKHLILDEADVLLDPLFRTHTLSVWNSLVNPELNTSLWSATISSSIEAEIRNIFTQRQQSSNRSLVRLVVGLKDSAVPNISHRLVYCATEQGKLVAIRDLISRKSSSTSSSSPPLRPPFLIFTQTISRATSLHSELKFDIPPQAGGSSRIAVLHSDLPDRVRDKILTQFRKAEIWILITTDLLSRGLDFPGVNGVVNYDIPTTAAAYVHRVGRTGRAGREGGVAVTLYTKDDIDSVKVVANVISLAERYHSSKDEKGVQDWLLNALPDVSREKRKLLKVRGVEGRRKGVKGSDITSKSGYVKRQENKKRNMIGASKNVTHDKEDDEFKGLSD